MDRPPLDPAQFPITRRVTYLNTARHGPLPRTATAAVERFLGEAGSEAGEAWERWDERHARIRERGVRLLGATSAADVCLIPSTTALIGAVAVGLDLGPGDRVVARRAAFPTTRLVWEGLAERGVEVDLLDDDTTWAEALQRPAAAVSLAWVRTDSGERTDLAAIAAQAHDAGAVVVVDAIQGVGIVPAALAAWGVDAAGAAGFKWLLAPEGTGLGYLAPSLRARLRPAHPGWYSEYRGAAGEDGLRPALAFVEGGSPNSMGDAALAASLDLLLDAGPARVWDHVQQLTARLREGLARLGAQDVSPAGDQGSAIVCAGLPDPQAAHRALRDAGVVVTPRVDGVRVSPHGFNTASDIDRLLDVLAG